MTVSMMQRDEKWTERRKNVTVHKIGCAEHREGIFVGYRYYDTADVPVLYPFGYGLSYTSFAYSGLEVGKDGIRFLVKNTGEMDGAEIVQMYVSLPDAKIFRPKKELKGIQKVWLKAGEEKQVRIPFDEKTFRYYNVKTERWEVEEGTYQIFVGADSLDIRLEGSIHISGTTQEYPYRAERLPDYYKGTVTAVPDSEFEALFGRPVPSGKWAGQIGKNDAICQLYYAKSGLARFIFKRLEKKKEKTDAKGVPDLNILFIYNMPFRAIAKMSGGMVSMAMVDGMVLLVNGHFFRGMGKIIGGFFKNRSRNKAYEKRLRNG